ncbi:MAG: helix-turn-helix transcriptional regulator [Clostridia bacterium]
MRTWEEYKERAKASSPQVKVDLEQAEQLAGIVHSLIERRTELGLSQRQLSELCGLPQSSVARIETMKTIPNVETVLRITQPLGLRLTLVDEAVSQV